MKINEFIKQELTGWKNFEIIGLVIVLVTIFASTVTFKDSPAAVINAVCGILYTIFAGKGKISCYFFGLAGSGCYIYLTFNNALWGNLLLYLCYYIPMQILGIFKWKQHLKQTTKEIIKTRLAKSELAKLTAVSIIGCLTAIVLLRHYGDSSPIIDGITTALSIVGMYLTVKRCIEQWIVWMIVNGLSAIMWLNIVIHGAKAYATVIMWSVYFILAIYFYYMWKKELETQNSYRL